MTELTPEDWIELMEGGDNHGRVRGADGGWHDMDYESMVVWQEGYEIFQGVIHGDRSTYVAGCRCRSCKRANRDYQRDRRASM